MPSSHHARNLSVSSYLSACLALCVLSFSYGHHLTSVRFDTDTDTAISGAITRVDWRNPHVYLYMEGVNAVGEQVIWEIEGPPPATLRRAGWSRETVAIGAQVTINGNPGRDPERNIFLFDSLEIQDEIVMGLAQGLAALPQQDAAITERATSIAGTWGTNFSRDANMKLINTAALPLTDKGAAAVRSYNEVEDNPGIECVPATSPAVMLVPDIKSIEVRDDVVLIRAEQEAMERIVYLKQDSHDAAVESIHGHSIGHWEGSTLLIDTTHFTPHRQGNATGLPSGRQKHLMERLTLEAGGSRLNYSYELSDPEYLQSTLSDQIQWSYRPDLEYVALPCDRENARKFAL